jgi:hypothetical protein
MKESEQSCPMALGGGWVEDGHIGNRKAMACAGISLDQMVRRCVGQILFEAVFLFFGETRVFDNTRDIDTAGYAAFLLSTPSLRPSRTFAGPFLS